MQFRPSRMLRRRRLALMGVSSSLLIAAAWGCSSDDTNGVADGEDASQPAVDSSTNHPAEDASDSAMPVKDASAVDAADAADGAAPECVPTATRPCVRAVFGGVNAANLCAVIDKPGETGVVECWGSAGDPAIGFTPTAVGPLDGGDPGVAYTPQIVNIGKVKDLDIGAAFSCAVDLDGGVRCWNPSGGNPDLPDLNINQFPGEPTKGGALGSGNTRPVTAPPAAPILGGAQSVGVEGVSGSSAHACARIEDAAVYCWGSNGSGELGLAASVASKLVPTKNPAPAAADIFVSSGETLSVGAGDGGSVSFSGINPSSGNPAFASRVFAAAGLDVRQVVTGGGGALCALHATKRVSCLLSNVQGWLGVDPNTTDFSTTALDVGLTNVEEIATEGQVVCARTGDGKVWCWGAAAGAVGIDPANAAAFTFYQSNYLLYTPTAIAGVTNAVQIALGSAAGCARTRDGALTCWGLRLATGTGPLLPEPQNYTAFITAQPVTKWQ